MKVNSSPGAPHLTSCTIPSQRKQQTYIHIIQTKLYMNSRNTRLQWDFSRPPGNGALGAIGAHFAPPSAAVEEKKNVGAYGASFRGRLRQPWF